MSIEHWIGVDPGYNGGVAIVHGDGWAEATPISTLTRSELLTLLIGHVRFANGNIVAAIEKVHAMPKQGVSSTFKFGCAFGEQRMALVAAGIPFDEVLPRKWQQAAGLTYPKGSTQTERKNFGKQRAQELFPQIKITHAVADALLIAHACRIILRGSDGQ